MEKAPSRAKRVRPRAGFFTKLLILALLIALGAQLYRIHGKLAQAEAEKARLTEQLSRTAAENQALQDGIDSGGSDEEMRKVARKDLGMVDPNDKIFYDTSN